MLFHGVQLGMALPGERYISSPEEVKEIESFLIIRIFGFPWFLLGGRCLSSLAIFSLKSASPTSCRFPTSQRSRCALPVSGRWLSPRSDSHLRSFTMLSLLVVNVARARRRWVCLFLPESSSVDAAEGSHVFTT